jgi:hypothetical protein
MINLPPVIKIKDARESISPIIKVNNKIFKVKG